MSDIGCLMTDPMMRAVLSNNKDVTRRIGRTWARAKVGDRLWFREVWAMATCPECDGEGWIDDPNHPMHSSQTGDEDGQDWCLDCNPGGENEIGRDVPIYRCDYAGQTPVKWRSSLLMPRSVCRATGIITSIGQVPLQDIDEADALREGMGTLTWADVVALASGRTLRSTLVKLMMAWDSPPAVDSHGTEIEQREWFGRLSMHDRFRLGFSLIHSHELWQMNPLVWRVEWRRE